MALPYVDDIVNIELINDMIQKEIRETNKETELSVDLVKPVKLNAINLEMYQKIDEICNDENIYKAKVQIEHCDNRNLNLNLVIKNQTEQWIKYINYLNEQNENMNKLIQEQNKQINQINCERKETQLLFKDQINKMKKQRLNLQNTSNLVLSIKNLKIDINKLRRECIIKRKQQYPIKKILPMSI